MSQSKRKLSVVLFLFLVLALASMACGGSDNVAAAPEALSPAQEKQQAMEDAAYYNAFVVVFEYKHAGADDKYGICNGSTKVVSLEKGETRRVELTSQEALNASLCQWNEESGGWGSVQDIGGVSPGDYLLWDTCLHWTRYTPK